MPNPSAAPSASPSAAPGSASGATPPASSWAIVRTEARLLLKNFGLFFVVLLPAMAIASMVGENVALFEWKSSPSWHIGWNPLLWVIMTAPWIAPTVVLVPVIHFVGRGVRKRMSRRAARSIVIGVSGAIFPLGAFALFGSGSGTDGAQTYVPLLLASIAYGAALRIPSSGAS